MADSMPLDSTIPDTEIDRLNFHVHANVHAPLVAQILMERLEGAAWDAFYQHFTEHGEDVLARCRWAETWLPRSRQHRKKANTLWFILGALIADVGQTIKPIDDWMRRVVAAIDWLQVDIDDLVADCPHLVPPTPETVNQHRPGLLLKPDKPFLAFLHGTPTRAAAWRHLFNPTLHAEHAERAAAQTSIAILRYWDLSWEFGATPELIMLAPLAAMAPGHGPADAVRRAVVEVTAVVDMDDNIPRQVRDIAMHAGIWHGSPCKADTPAPSSPRAAQPDRLCAWRPEQQRVPSWSRWVTTPRWWEDNAVVHEMASCAPVDLFVTLAREVPRWSAEILRDLCAHSVDLVFRLLSSSSSLEGGHPAWRDLSSLRCRGYGPVSGIGTYIIPHGTPALVDVVKPFLRAVIRRTDSDTMLEVVCFQRTWLLICLDWIRTSPLSADGVQPDADSLLKNLDGPDATEATSCTRIVAGARRVWHEIAVAARLDQQVDSGIHDAHLAMELVIRTKGLSAGFKAIFLLLRALRQPSVGPSLATSISVEGGSYMLGRDETRGLPWSWVADDGVGIIQAMRSRDRTGSHDVLQEIGEMLLERLKPAPPRKPDQPRPMLVKTSGDWHSDMLEPSAIWRRGYVRAVGELAVPQPHRICRVLEHVRRMDPDRDVQVAANDAIQSLSERSRRLGHDAPARLLMHVWWRLRWAHRLALGLDVDHITAFGTRRIEVRTKRLAP